MTTCQRGMSVLPHSKAQAKAEIQQVDPEVCQWPTVNSLVCCGLLYLSYAQLLVVLIVRTGIMSLRFNFYCFVFYFIVRSLLKISIISNLVSVVFVSVTRIFSRVPEQLNNHHSKHSTCNLMTSCIYQRDSNFYFNTITLFCCYGYMLLHMDGWIWIMFITLLYWYYCWSKGPVYFNNINSTHDAW